MDALAPAVSWLAGVLSQAVKALPAAAPVVAAPAPVAAIVTPAPVPISLGLKVLLEPTAGGLIFRAACNTVGTIYPVYASAKAIESADKADDVQWLTYWTIFGSLTIAEYALDQALSRVPFYYHAKFAALLWLQLPQSQGAAYLYQQYYKPALAKYGRRIDAVLAKGQAALEALYATYKVPLDAAWALLLAARRQALAALAWLLAEEGAAGAAGAGKGAKAKPQ